jgi:hypothetical protein
MAWKPGISPTLFPCLEKPWTTMCSLKNALEKPGIFPAYDELPVYHCWCQWQSAKAGLWTKKIFSSKLWLWVHIKILRTAGNCISMKTWCSMEFCLLSCVWDSEFLQQRRSFCLPTCRVPHQARSSFFDHDLQEPTCTSCWQMVVAIMSLS